MKLHRTLALGLALLLPTLSQAREQLTAEDVKLILEQGLSQAQRMNPQAIIAVTDREGFLIGLYTTDTAYPRQLPAFPTILPPLDKLNAAEKRLVQQTSKVVGAITRASTAAFLSSNQNAFTTRTAGYIIQQHFPPGVRNTPPGPLVGVGFSSLFYSDVNRVKLPVSLDGLVFNGAAPVPPTISPGVRAPLVALTSLNDSPGGVPLYKNDELVGGVGVTGDGSPTDLTPAGAIFFNETNPNATSGFRTGRDADEEVALAAQTGFRPSSRIVATNVTINGVRIPYTFTPEDKIEPVKSVKGLDNLKHDGAHPIDLLQPTLSLNSQTAAQIGPLFGVVPTGGITAKIADFSGEPQASPAPYPYPVKVLSGVTGEVRFPFRDDPLRNSSGSRRKIKGKDRLSAEEVQSIISNAADRAARTRAGIRLPIGTDVKVFISVVGNPDKPGEKPPILGVFRVGEATIFSWDVSVQKARTALFHSNSQLAMSARTVGFMAQRWYPPGLDGRPWGPLFGFQEAVSLRQRPISSNAPKLPDGRKVYPPVGGMQLEFENPFLPTQLGFPGNPNLPNGLTIFPGGFPLYRDGIVVGAIGISGDGVDQDDLIGASGTVNFQPRPAIRADSYILRGARLPYVKFPRDPEQ